MSTSSERCSCQAGAAASATLQRARTAAACAPAPAPGRRCAAVHPAAAPPDIAKGAVQASGVENLPPALRAALDRYEAGGSMLDVETAPWPGVATETAALRQAVWADELGLPEAAAVDSQDPEAWHALARNRMGLAVGCGRLVVGEGRIGEIGRMSVLHAVRGGGVGRALLAALVAQARQQRLQTVRLQAQRSAVGFYARAGFVVANAEPMVLAGVPHVPMGLRLA